LQGLIVGKWPKTLLFIVLSPLIGFLLAYLLMTTVYLLFRQSTPAKMDYYFRKLQLVSAALFSFAHGSNDAQKTMGIVTGVLFASKYIDTFHVPVWVIFAAHAAIGLGTLSGGWRIVRTMGGRITRLKPRGGFCAETAGAIAILFPTCWDCRFQPRTQLRGRSPAWEPFTASRPSAGASPPRLYGRGC